MLKYIFDKILDLIPFVSCQEATRLISKKMDTSLTFKETVDLYLHLSVCDLCKKFKKSLLALEKLVQHYSPVGEYKLSTTQKQALKNILKQEQ